MTDSLPIHPADDQSAAVAIAPRRWLAPSWFCALSPWLLLIVLLTLAAHARLSLGHWPTPMFENFSTPAFEIHGLVCAIVGYLTGLVAGPLWCVFLLIRPLRPSARLAGWQLLTAAVGSLAVYTYVTYDPSRFIEWILD